MKPDLAELVPRGRGCREREREGERNVIGYLGLLRFYSPALLASFAVLLSSRTYLKEGKRQRASKAAVEPAGHGVTISKFGERACVEIV